MTDRRAGDRQHITSHLIAKQLHLTDNNVTRGIWVRFKQLLALRVDGASLAVLRIALGLVMALEAYALCVSNAPAISSGKSPLENYYVGPEITFHFPYSGFEWLPLLSGPWIYTLVAVLALAGFTMALGLFYRASVATVFCIWTYLWVVESTRSYWQSHYYLEVLLTFLMIWMPAANRYSIDAWRRRHLAETVPFWTVFLLRGQLVIAYFYAGVAKLNKDWLLDAVPVRWFLTKPEVASPYEPYLTAAQLKLAKQILHSTEFAYFVSYAGAIFDLSVGFLLLIRRTRILAIILMWIFHATNHLVIFDDIGWFPLMGITTALIFLDCDWPQRLWGWLRRPRLKRPDGTWLAGGTILVPFVGAALGWKLHPSSVLSSQTHRPWLRNRVALFVLAWLTWQTLVPLRHYLIPGDGRFSYEGMSFSWRLKADARHCTPHELYIGDRDIVYRDDSGRPSIDWEKWPDDKVLYRVVTPQRIDWTALPEIVVVLQPIIGERIYYNPYSRYAGRFRTEKESQARVQQIWQELYQRSPRAAPTRPLSEVLVEIVSELQASGVSSDVAGLLAELLPLLSSFDESRGTIAKDEMIRRRALDLLTVLTRRNETVELLHAHLESLDPFAMEGQHRLPIPFLRIDDAQLALRTSEGYVIVDRRGWKTERFKNDERDPLIVYLGEIDADLWQMLPQAFITDFLDYPARAALIRWNSAQDLTISKLMHTSLQPFYLRRYAVRVADLWEAKHGRRPTIHALTKMSLNGRPHQLLVDPGVDLASVPVKWLTHNEWIRQLQYPRIPRENLDNQQSSSDSDTALQMGGQ